MMTVILKAMLDMVVDQLALGVAHGLLNSMQLLREIETGPPLLNHRNDRPDVTFGSLEALGDRGM